ncbi:MAG: hypothetical protein NUW37_03040 [Planctomycetes bacterium]|nr:hypothetical protein [Planctomycetota bacterium]
MLILNARWSITVLFLALLALAISAHDKLSAEEPEGGGEAAEGEGEGEGEAEAEPEVGPLGDGIPHSDTIQDIPLTYSEITPRDRKLQQMEPSNKHVIANPFFWYQIRLIQSQESIPADLNAVPENVRFGEKLKLMDISTDTFQKDGVNLGKDSGSDGSIDERIQVDAERATATTVKVKYESGLERDYHIEWIQFNKYQWPTTGWHQIINPDPPVYRLAYRRNCYVKGTIEGTDFYIFDDNCNGKFNDYGIDSMLFGDSNICTPLSRLMCLKDKWKVLAMNPEGTEMKAADYSGAFGKFELKPNYPRGVELRWAMMKLTTTEGAYVDVLPYVKNRMATPNKTGCRNLEAGGDFPVGEWQWKWGLLMMMTPGASFAVDATQTVEVLTGKAEICYINENARRTQEYKIGLPDSVRPGEPFFESDFATQFIDYNGISALYVGPYSNPGHFVFRGKVNGEEYMWFKPKIVLGKIEVFDATGRQQVDTFEFKEPTGEEVWEALFAMYPDFNLDSTYRQPRGDAPAYKIRILWNIPMFGQFYSEFKDVQRNP